MKENTARIQNPVNPAKGSIVLGRYRLAKQIARGGMGAVYLGHLQGAAGFQRTVAIKRMLPEVMELEGWREAVLREAANASRVRHPNVVSIDDVEELGDELLLIMEYIDGGSLFQVIQAGKMPLEISLRIALDVAQGLIAIHEARDDKGGLLGLVHRDVSPQNVIVGLDGISRVTDFGIAKTANDTKRTAKGLLRGKMGYMAPEYISHGTAQASVDMFAFGVVLWELLAGERLFRVDSDFRTIRNTLATQVPPIPGVPGEVFAVVTKALSRQPVDRFDTMRTLASALVRASVATVATHAEVSAYVVSALKKGPTDISRDPTRLAPAEPPASNPVVPVAPKAHESQPIPLSQRDFLPVSHQHPALRATLQAEEFPPPQSLRKSHARVSIPNSMRQPVTGPEMPPVSLPIPMPPPSIIEELEEFEEENDNQISDEEIEPTSTFFQPPEPAPGPPPVPASAIFPQLQRPLTPNTTARYHAVFKQSPVANDLGPSFAVSPGILPATRAVVKKPTMDAKMMAVLVAIGAITIAATVLIILWGLY